MCDYWNDRIPTAQKKNEVKYQFLPPPLWCLASSVANTYHTCLGTGCNDKIIWFQVQEKKAARHFTAKSFIWIFSVSSVFETEDVLRRPVALTHVPFIHIILGNVFSSCLVGVIGTAAWIPNYSCILVWNKTLRMNLLCWRLYSWKVIFIRSANSLVGKALIIHFTLTIVRCRRRQFGVPQCLHSGKEPVHQRCLHVGQLYWL